MNEKFIMAYVSMSIKKIGKYLLRFVLLIILLLVLLAAILQIPAVQNYIADKATNYLKETLKTEVRLHSIHLRLPESLVIEGFYMEDLEKDTLISVGELAVNFTLNKLLQKQIQFDEVTLKNGVANIEIDINNVANFDFIIEAFAPTEDGTLPEPTSEKPTASSWELTFNNTDLNLEKVGIKYDDDFGAIDFRGNIGELSGGTDDIDLAKGIFNIDDLALRNSDISLKIGESLASEDRTTTVLDYAVTAAELTIENIHFDFQMLTLEMVTYLNEVALEDLEVRLKGEDIGVKSSQFLMENSDFAYAIPNTLMVQNGFDTNHFGFKNINIEIADLDYQNMDISADIQRLHLEDGKGFILENARTKIAFSEKELLLENFLLDTKKSLITSEKTQIQYPFLAENSGLKDLLANVNLNIEKLAIADVQYFYPDLDSIEFFRKNKAKFLTAKVIGSGNLEEFQLKTFELDNWNTKIRARGLVRNTLDTLNAYFDLNVSHFRITDKGILDWLPPNTLPEYVELPNVLNFKGKFKGKLNDFNARLNGQTTRIIAPVASELEIFARIKNIMDLDRAFFDIRLDSLYTTKQGFMAYLPPGTIPEYIELPNKLMLKGTAKGTMKNLNSDFKLSSVRNGKVSDFLASGSVSDLLSGNIGFDITLESAEFSQADLQSFLPDSLLPAYLKLPFINKIRGIVQGNAENFKSKLSFNANGNWAAEAALKQEAYDVNLNVDNLDLEGFFENNYLDTLVGFTPSPWKVELSIKGTGFDFHNDMNADLRLQVRKAGENVAKGLIIEGKLQQEKLVATAIAKEEEINLESKLIVDFTKKMPEIKYDLELAKLDLQALGLSEKPFVVRTKMYADVKSYMLDSLVGTVKFRNLDVLYDSTFQQIDSLEIVANLDNGNNLVEVTSDVFDAHLEGYFKYPEIVEIGENFFNNYYKVAAKDSVLNREKANFDFVFDLHQPELLTSGLIEGLAGLSPFVVTTTFNNEKDKLQLNANLDYLNYQGAVFDSLKLNIDANRDFVNYELAFQNADYQDIVDIANFKMFGDYKNKLLTNNLEIFDELGSKRFDLKTFIEVLPEEVLSLKLADTQLLNYENWKVSERNNLRFGENKLKVMDWKLFKEKQFMQIANQGKNGVIFNFDNFDLAFISNFISVENNIFDGRLNGQILMNNPMESPIVEADIRLYSLVVLDAKLGDLELIADNATNVKIKTDLTLKGQGNDLELKGVYDLNNTLEALDFQLDIAALSLKSIEPLTLGYLEKAEGFFKGNLEITGSLEQPSLLGKTHFEKAAFDVGLLKTRLKIGDQPIVFDANAIEFDNLKIYDAKDNEGTISSYLLTPNYREFFLNTDIHVEDFQVLNTTDKDSNLYYGKLKVDADVTLRGSLDEPVIEVTAKPEKESDLTYIYTANSNTLVSHEGIVEFVNPFEENTRVRVDKPEILDGASALNMKVIVRMSINENLKFKAMIDPITGDNFEGKAEGDIVFIQNPDGSMEMTGSVAVVEGDYLFTYQNVVRRKFNVKPGSSVTWIGVPENPKLDVNILYKTVTSPYPLLAGSAEDVENNSALTARQNFQVNLNVSGTASNTNIATSIEYLDGRNGNTEVSAAIDRINQDPNQQNTQAFALILFNGFIAQNTGLGGFQILGTQSSINEVITQQLNNLANKYIKFVELDFGLEEGEGSGSSTDFKVSIRKRFLNDRLTIVVDGKVSTDQNASGSQSFLDNITVDYSLTPDGRFKIKIYNQQEFDDYSGVAAVKLGGAFVFSKDFNGIKLFGNKKDK
jgi:hypothetical protein